MINIEFHPHPAQTGKMYVSWMTPVDRVLDKLTAPLDQCNSALLDKGETAPLLYIKGNNKEIGTAETVQKKPNKEIYKMTKIDDIVFKYKKKEVKIPSKVTPHTMELLWKQLNAKHYPNDYCVKLTGSEIGYLKSIISKVNPSSKLPDKLSVVFEDWSGFTVYTQVQKGTKNVPAKPSLPFLSTHVSELMNFEIASVQSIAQENVVVDEKRERKTVKLKKLWSYKDFLISERVVKVSFLYYI